MTNGEAPEGAARQAITEEQGIHKQWYEDAEKVENLDQLMGFLKHLLEDYQHDYGTICHALSAGAVATCWAMDRVGGGITGFQAGCVMWGFIGGWNQQYRDKPLRFVNFENMLYPQYADKFSTEMSAETWKWLQDQAAKNLETEREVHPNVWDHWQSIVNGGVPFGWTAEAKP